MGRNHFPPHYAENISEVNLPGELIPQYTTVEYELQSQPVAGPPTFIFLVDTCVDEDELAHLRDSLQQTLNLLPEDSLVGLVTFGSLVQVHELGFNECPRSYIFRGDKDYPAQKIQDMLGILSMRGGNHMMSNSAGGPGGASGPIKQSAIGRFLMPVGECSYALEQILDDLQKDPWPTQPDERVQRCTGTALGVAVGLLETAVPRQGSRIMLFTAGPVTTGSGSIVVRAKKESIRSHADLLKSQAPLHKPAVAYYTLLAERAIASSIVVDVFASSLDQIGTLEIKVLATRSGGLIVLADSFGQSIFKESLRRVFERAIDPATGAPTGPLQMGFSGQIEVLHSREFKISGAIGSVASLKKTGPGVSETEIGVG
jgi:protein transport protein SEC23